MKHRVTEWGLALHDGLKSARCLGAESSVDTPIPEAKALAASATDRFWIRAKLRLPGALPPRAEGAGIIAYPADPATPAVGSGVPARPPSRKITRPSDIFPARRSARRSDPPRSRMPSACSRPERRSIRRKDLGFADVPSGKSAGNARGYTA